MAEEMELKYQATGEILEKILEKYPAQYEFTMETTYFDTKNQDMKRLRWTLRRRLENGNGVCSLKTPGDFIHRGEWEVPGEDLPAALPELCALGAPDKLLEYGKTGLFPVCGARFTRRASLLTLAGATVELAADRGAFLAGERQQPFAEVEVELKSGNEKAALAFGAALAAEFGLIPETRGKVERAMALNELTVES